MYCLTVTAYYLLFAQFAICRESFDFEPNVFTLWCMLHCYTPIASNERVTFWLQHAQSLPCACAFVTLYACALRDGYTQAYAQIMQHTHTHKAVTGRVEAKKVTLSSKATKL